MALFRWNDTYSVGVTEIDDQHRNLVDMINRLHDGLGEGKGSEVIGPILNDMAEYAQYHFDTEEGYFKEFRFRETDIHTAEHMKFKRKVDDFCEKYKTDPMILSVEVMYFLSNWLKNHIQGSDKNYTKCFNDNGLV
jgi:hemerythrin